MRVTYISHTGFLVETETVCLLFDYWNGEVPEIPAAKPLYIFASHRHEDHFHPAIFTLPGLPEDTHWLLSYDILRDKKFYLKHPEAEPLRDAGRIESMRMDQEYEIGDLCVWPLKSTDEGVGFLVKIPAEECLIYHAGDLNWWLWEGEPEQRNRFYTGMFKKQVKNLAELVRQHGDSAGRDKTSGIPHLNLGFFTMDPRQEQYEFHGFDYYLQHIPVDCAFPMHCWDQYEVIDRYLELRSGAVEELLPATEDSKEADAANLPGIRVAHIRKRGEVYEV